MAPVAVLLALVLALPAISIAAPPSNDLAGSVVYVADGDTIHVQLRDRVEKVRYIGINAPEIPHPPPRGQASGPGERRRLRFFPHTAAAGEAAKRVNVELVAGKHVRLELDRRRRDNYKRLLAYVWVDDTMINAEMVRRGYAEVMSIPPDFRHRALFMKLQAEARAARRGLWQVSVTVKRASAARPRARSARP